MTDKVILTNRSALVAKYKTAGANAIGQAVQDLITADRTRGLNSVRVDIDSETAMKKYGGAAVTDAKSAMQNKRAVDAVYKSAAPDYILLLGSVDVIPHQELRNPVFNPRRPNDDSDAVVPSDLPYACEAGYSKAIEDFTGPTRVAGRLPDVTGGKDPAYLIGLLKTAAEAKSRPRADYDKHLGITANVWKKSTAMSLQAVFGANEQEIVPPDAPPWSATLLGRRSHFVNCHGAPKTAEFYGQKGSRFPVSLEASQVAGKLTAGALAAMECCYGAELYDPAEVHGQAGMGNTYLESGAYGYLGSTTIAYGPADSNEWADVLCQEFLRSALAGASLGRALLEARQKYVQTGPTPLGPMDLKTLAQFVLLGDPSVVAVQEAAPVTPAPAVKLLAKSRAFAPALSGRTTRVLRRKDLITTGLSIAKTWPAVRSRASATPASAAKKLKALASQLELENPSMMTYHAPKMRQTSMLQPKALLAKQADVTAVHVMFGNRPVPRGQEKIHHTVAVVVRQAGNEIVSVVEGYAK